ncbi:uncharacterized protein LOC124816230 [Hydra vulgaris]|uniref:uncharacterized protein LOC124816230 n=1 Tax=Hydra vulgaris TaxID=6087 RepID=UPI0032EA3EDC
MKCFYCSNFHHAAMCINKIANKKIDIQENYSSSLASLLKCNNSVLLQTVRVNVTANNINQPARILLNSCSQLSYILPSLRSKLNLKTLDSKRIVINTFGNQSETEVLERVQFTVKDTNGCFDLIFCFVKDICATINGQNIDFSVRNYNHLKGLALADIVVSSIDSPVSDSPVSVDILVGADFYWKFFGDTVVKGNSGPVALKFNLGGYVLNGCSGKKKGNSFCVNTVHVLKVQSNFVEDDIVLKSSLKEMWGYKDSCLGRYMVDLPFRGDEFVLPDNYSLYIDLFNSYNNITKYQLSQIIIEKVSVDDLNAENVHYLPHRPVERDDKITTKVRMVFDASAKSYGASLNECLYSGPSLTTSLFGTLLRFRSKRFSFIADIEKVFLQIGLTNKCRDYVRFLWYNDINNISVKNLSNQKLISYRLCKVLFGVTSSPFLFNGTLKLHLEQYLRSNSSYVNKLVNSLYVDDVNSCFDEVSQCINFYKWCKLLLKEGGFNLRKFESNCKDLESTFQDEPSKKKMKRKFLVLSGKNEMTL